jgi:DNA-binding transcriptional ArsR family regulator
MTDRNFVVVPDTNIISVRLEPVWAVLNSLQMMNELDEYPGMHSWMYDTWAQLSEQQRRDNHLVFGFLSSVLFESTNDGNFATFAEMLDYLATQDPIYLRDAMLQEMCWLPDFKKREYPDLIQPTPAELLADPEVLLNFIRGMHKELRQDEVDLMYVAHDLLQRPAEMKALIIDHSRYMWEKHLKAEWERTKPLMEETVNAFRRVDFNGMDRFEAVKFVTARELRETSVGDVLDHATHLVFTPAPHMGPYVATFMRKDTVYVLFRPRLPEGITPQSTSMGRSDLLVRVNALADDTRLLILELFANQEELCAQDVMELLNLSQSATSRHLRQLTASGYLTERRRETAKCYSLNRARVEDTLQAMRQFLLGR